MTWRPVAIDGFESLYEVNVDGDIRRSAPGKHTYIGRVLHGSINTDGYRVVKLSRGSRATKRQVTVHQVVARTFIPNPQSKPEVNHLSGDKLDNRVLNLDWATNKENEDHAIALGLIGKPKQVEGIGV